MKYVQPMPGEDIVYRFLSPGGYSVPYAMKYDPSQLLELIEDPSRACVWWSIDGQYVPEL